MGNISIKPGLYTGYLWKSNSKEPEIYTEDAPFFQKGEDFNNRSNPFIIEGMLYDCNNQLSYSISFNDGEYFIMEYDLSKISAKDSVRRSFLGNKMNGLFLNFIELFKETRTDDECGFNVLEPSSLIFIGFEK